MTKIAILGVGHALPTTVRDNDDPVFDWLRHNPPSSGEIFDGLKHRRVLATPEQIVGLVAAAARAAAGAAGVALSDLDVLVGSASSSAFVAPTDLCAVHGALGLPATCRILPLASDYTAFHDGLSLAHDMITSGSARRVLVAVGNNWTHHVDYHEAVALAASDAAGAAIVGATEDANHFTLIDREDETDTSWFGALRLTPRLAERGQGRELFTRPLMTIDDQRGAAAILHFGLPRPPAVIARLLERNGVAKEDVTLVAHQSSRTILDAWKKAVQPRVFVDTLEELADMVSASAAVNLAQCHDTIETSHLVIMGIGMEMRATALLYART